MCARRLRQKGETEKRAYHNSIYRFVFFFRLYILLSFLQRGKERERKKRKGRLSLFRQLFSHFIHRGEGLLISTTRVRGLWVRHKKRKEKQKKNTGCVQTKERNVRPFKRASNLQRTSHSGGVGTLTRPVASRRNNIIDEVQQQIFREREKRDNKPVIYTQIQAKGEPQMNSNDSYCIESGQTH